MTLQVIGSVVDRSNGGMYSGKAFVRSLSTTDFNDNWFDLGFRPEQLYVENVSGTGILQLTFHHLPEGDTATAPSGIYSEVDPASSRVYRRRNHQYIGVKSLNGPCVFRIEAW
jgi:hypothetical protein